MLRSSSSTAAIALWTYASTATNRPARSSNNARCRRLGHSSTACHHLLATVLARCAVICVGDHWDPSTSKLSVDGLISRLQKRLCQLFVCSTTQRRGLPRTQSSIGAAPRRRVCVDRHTVAARHAHLLVGAELDGSPVREHGDRRHVPVAVREAGLPRDLTAGRRQGDHVVGVHRLGSPAFAADASNPHVSCSFLPSVRLRCRGRHRRQRQPPRPPLCHGDCRSACRARHRPRRRRAARTFLRAPGDGASARQG